MWDKSYLEKLNEYKAKSVAGGGEARVEKQHSQGKLTARERLEILFDKGTFREIGALRVSTSLDLPESKRIFGDGVVTGYGKVNGRTVYVVRSDPPTRRRFARPWTSPSNPCPRSSALTTAVAPVSKKA